MAFMAFLLSWVLSVAQCGVEIDVRRPRAQSRKLVEEEIDGGDPAVPCNNEIGPGVRWRLARGARHPLAPRSVAQFLRRGDRLILIVWVSGLDYAGDAVDRVATTVDPLVGVVEHGLFIVELVDGRATTRRVFFAEDITEIAKKELGCCVGHDLSPDADLRPFPLSQAARIYWFSV